MPTQPNVLDQIRQNIEHLNTSIDLITQRLRHFSYNDKLLLTKSLAFNKKLIELRDDLNRQLSGGRQDVPADLKLQLDRINNSLNEVNEKLALIWSNYTKKDEFVEVKKLVDFIGPNKFVTREDVKEIIDEMLKEGSGKTSSVKKKK